MSLSINKLSEKSVRFKLSGIKLLHVFLKDIKDRIKLSLVPVI